jgi:hypothetical protein
MLKLLHFSAVRFTDLDSPSSAPSSELLGYFHSSANADWDWDAFVQSEYRMNDSRRRFNEIRREARCLPPAPQIGLPSMERMQLQVVNDREPIYYGY